jgi:hypothetical protein
LLLLVAAIMVGNLILQILGIDGTKLFYLDVR